MKRKYFLLNNKNGIHCLKLKINIITTLVGEEVKREFSMNGVM